MDQMCNKVESEDVNKASTNEKDSENAEGALERCPSPVFKCMNPSKPIRPLYSNTSDCDIPCYQISHSVKSRTSSKYDSENSESVLPFSPIFSPIPVPSSLQFLPPSIHSVGTVVKNSGKFCKDKVDGSGVKDVKKSGGVFESLGMNDKDISWVSSMASPPPPHIPGSEFNSIERAVFLPEDNFQSIQPRALFSPTLDDDFVCHPITFSSDSEDDEAYKSNIRLSDVCATLNRLEVKSLEQVSDTGESVNEETAPLSPVIKTKVKKSEGVKKKKKSLLIVSPSNDGNYEFSVGETLSEKKKNNSSQSSNFIEDDSFQSMSFSGLDELCKTLVNGPENSNSSCLSRPSSDCDRTLVNNSVILDSKPVEKQFYVSKTTPEVHSVSSMENLHSYAATLEEGDVNIPGNTRIDKSVVEKGIVRLDVLERDSPKKDGTKRSHSELSEDNDESKEKKFKKIDDDSSNGETMKKYLSESQWNISEGEIFRTVENLEKTLASQENKDLEKLGERSQISLPQNEVNPGEKKDCAASNDEGGTSRNLQFEGFTTALGSKISVSEKALRKARELLKDCEEPSSSVEAFSTCSDEIRSFLSGALEKASGECPGGFTTASGRKVEVSEEALKKGKALMAECDESEPKNYMKGFSTGSGKKIQVSAGALEKAKKLMSEVEGGPEDSSGKLAASWMRGFSTGSGKKIEVSPEALEKAKKLMSECEAKVERPSGNLAENWMKGLGKTGSKIEVSPEALEKAKALMSACDEDLKETSEELASIWMEELADETSTKFAEKSKCGFSASSSGTEKTLWVPPVTGFSTPSGIKVKVSAEALEKARSLLSEVDEVVEKAKVLPEEPQPFLGFSTASGCKVIISEEALAKARESMARWEENQPDDSGNFDCADSFKASVKSAEGLNQGKREESPSTTSGIEEAESDWDEIVPGWLHVYSTSPSMASDRIGASPIVSHEDGRAERPEREYIVKSPVLGSSDRFYKKIKRRKLRFEEGKAERKERTGAFAVASGDGGKKPSVKRNSNLCLDFSAPFKRTRLVEEERTMDLGTKVAEERRRARENQEKAIKEKQGVKPLKGSLLSRKCSEDQVSWMKAVKGASPEVHPEEFLRALGVREEVLSVSIESAGRFRFPGQDFFGPNCSSKANGISVGDGCVLIPDDENGFGPEEFRRGFLASPGVDPNLVPTGWLENHYKWIVWKLAHYERSFPRHFGGRCLTPNNVALQLKYRYDREIDRSERSALRKILERDDTSIKRMVLCVCGIKKVISGDAIGYELNLTDGWYNCPARTDPAMTRLVEKGKVSVGTKLMTQGAALINCESGVSPLEMNGDVYLKISTNSTRRIRWDAKLGFQRNPKNFPVSLNSILPQGGGISRLDVILVRIYPVLYMEKTSDGRHVTRNRRSEEKADAEYRRIQEERMEIIRSEVQSEMRKSAAEKRMNRNNLSDIEQVEDLCQLMETSSDPSALQELMSTDQKRLLQNFQLNRSDRFSREMREKIENKLKKEPLAKRNVSEFLRAKVVDLRKPDYNNAASLSVWNPNEELQALLSEGKFVSLTNVSISNFARAYKPLQINTTRQTQFREIIRNVKYPERKLTRLEDVSSKVCPAFEEVDLVGLVAIIRNVAHGSRLSQIVYLTDFESHFVGVVFWGSCKDYGWENVLKIRSVVACSNLQWKKNYSLQEVPSLHVSEHSTFTENPRRPHLKEEVDRLKGMMPQDVNAFLSKCEEELTAKLEESRWRGNTSRNSSGTEGTKPHLSNGFESKPTASSTPIKPFQTSAFSEEAEPSPIQKRIEKLQVYGEPPSLIPLLIRNNARRKLKKK